MNELSDITVAIEYIDAIEENLEGHTERQLWREAIDRLRKLEMAVFERFEREDSLS